MKNAKVKKLEIQKMFENSRKCSKNVHEYKNVSWSKKSLWILNILLISENYLQNKKLFCEFKKYLKSEKVFVNSKKQSWIKKCTTVESKDVL